MANTRAITKVSCLKMAKKCTKLFASLTACSLVMAMPAQAKLQLSGEMLQGALILGKTLPTSTVTLNDTEVKVSSNGDFAFGFGRDDQSTYILTVKNADGSSEQRTLMPKARDYKIQRISGISKKIMNPNPKAIKRAQADNLQIAKARKIESDDIAFAKGFIAPMKGAITGVYGSQRVFNGIPKRPHFGLDYAGKVGDPVKAPADGVITLYVPDMFYSGGTMIIDHGHGVTSTFLHLSDSYVKVGDKVSQGQLVAAVGKSGRVTGPHLDWRINWFNTRLDPALALKLKPIN